MVAPTAESSTEPSFKAVNTLPSQASQLYANLHPVLLLSLIFLSFARLVNDPVKALLSLVPVTAVLQAMYCVVCLPPTGQTAPAAPNKPGQKKKAGKASQGVLGKVVVRSNICLQLHTLHTLTIHT